MFLFAGTKMVLMFLAKSLFILYGSSFWNGLITTPAGFSFCVFKLYLTARAHLTSRLLYQLCIRILFTRMATDERSDGRVHHSVSQSYHKILLLIFR